MSWEETIKSEAAPFISLIRDEQLEWTPNHAIAGLRKARSRRLLSR
jgi:hypothetical protein